MSTRSWSFIAAGALLILAMAGFAIGYLLNRPRKEKENPEESQD